MSVSRIVEINAQSNKNFEDAIRQGIETASKTMEGNIEGAWVSEQQVIMKDGEIVGYRVDMKLSCMMN